MEQLIKKTHAVRIKRRSTYCGEWEAWFLGTQEECENEAREVFRDRTLIGVEVIKNG